ncbi:hypothetical protein [Synechococcus sp. WH 8020]|nr:hypothetical protein [Synechococcus sp. WH 8020]
MTTTIGLIHSSRRKFRHRQLQIVTLMKVDRSLPMDQSSMV